MANGPLPAWTKEALKYGGFGSGIGGAVLIIWLAIAQPMREDFRSFQNDQRAAAAISAKAMSDLREEFVRFRVEFTEWTRQVFVSRDLFDALKSETERRFAALEKK